MAFLLSIRLYSKISLEYTRNEINSLYVRLKKILNMAQSTEESIKQLKKIIEFRKTHKAPVDTMGCGCTSEKNDPKSERFQTLISLMLSSMTKDQETTKAVKNLQKMEGGLNAPNLSKASYDEVAERISCVGFYKKKAQNIIDAAKRCHNEYDDDVPKTLDELTSFKGVGIKMGTLAMAHCWNQQIGIGVDVHVHRISNLLGWVNTKKPDDTEEELQKVFPENIWSEINHALVGFGQSYCTKNKPKCSECPIRSSCRAFNADEDSDDE